MDNKIERMAIDIVATGNNLRKRRSHLGYEIKEVANLLGISERALYKQEEGKSLPSIDCLVRLSRLYEQSIDELLVLKDNHSQRCE